MMTKERNCSKSIETSQDTENSDVTEPSQPYLPVIEAIILAAPEPVSEADLIEFIEHQTVESIREAICQLNEIYDRTGRSFNIIGGGERGWYFATKPEYSGWVKQLVAGGHRIRLSRASLETISIIAYRQPISRAEIEAIRGVDVSGILRKLIERQLIIISGKADTPGKPRLYETTHGFLRHFGLDSLDQLPIVEDEPTDTTPD